MLDNTRRMNITWFAELSGGYHDPVGFNWMMDTPDEWWTIRRKPAAPEVNHFGRRPRKQPQTMPLIVALPILIWLIATGEIKWR